MAQGGDALARGARSATFGPAKISQSKWDSIWADEPQETKEKSEEVEKSNGE
jgi:hypothetical protein